MRRLIVSMVVVLALVFSLSSIPVLAQDYCNGNFDCDQDVDGTDAAAFKADYGRDQYNNPCPGCLPPAQVPKTGQTTSFATGDDGDLQKGVVWPNPRFTDNGNGTVTDNITGLIWLKTANCFGQRTWNNALSDSNGLEDGECGLTDGSSAGDWRLPDRRELFSLVHDEYYSPAVPNTAGTGQWSEGDPFNDVQSGLYWSSTTFAFSTDVAWAVGMGGGGVYDFIKTIISNVWPVRGGHSGSVTTTTTTTVSCLQQGEECIVSSECCDGCCCNAQGLNVCTTTEQCGFLGGGCD